jgi:hypothetical protein
MATLAQMIRHLQQQRKQIQRQIERIDAAVAALQKIGDKEPAAAGPKAKRVMSAAARRRISRAQKARWAKYKQQKAA